MARRDDDAALGLSSFSDLPRAFSTILSVGMDSKGLSQVPAGSPTPTPDCSANSRDTPSIAAGPSTTSMPVLPCGTTPSTPRMAVMSLVVTSELSARVSLRRVRQVMTCLTFAFPPTAVRILAATSLYSMVQILPFGPQAPRAAKILKAY